MPGTTSFFFVLRFINSQLDIGQLLLHLSDPKLDLFNFDTNTWWWWGDVYLGGFDSSKTSLHRSRSSESSWDPVAYAKGPGRSIIYPEQHMYYTTNVYVVHLHTCMLIAGSVVATILEDIYSTTRHLFRAPTGRSACSVYLVLLTSPRLCRQFHIRCTLES
jgi:hypothetical protein